MLPPGVLAGLVAMTSLDLRQKQSQEACTEAEGWNGGVRVVSD